MFGVLASNLRNEGIAGMYRGVSAPLLAVSPMFAVSFWGYDMGQRIVRWWDDQPIGQLSINQCIVAGGLSAIPATALMAPSERIKCLLQVPNHPYKGFWDCHWGPHRPRVGSWISGRLGTHLSVDLIRSKSYSAHSQC